MNRQKVAEALYDLLERVGVRFERDQAAELGAGLGTIITACIAAARQEMPDRCGVCTCLLPIQACGHSCCTQAGGTS